MKTKLKLLIPVIALTLAAFSTPPTKGMGSCSGDQCGCGVAMQACIAECPPVGDPGRSACVSECLREDRQCSIACCS